MALTPAERTAAYRLRNPYKLKTTTIVVDGVKYIIPNNAMKPSSAKGFIKFLNKLEKNPTIENYRKLVAKLPKDVANQVRNYRYYLQGIKSGSFSGEKTGENLKKLFQELDLPKKSTNFLRKVTTADIKAEIVKTSATPKRADSQLRASFNKVIAINKEFKKNPEIDLNTLTKNLYKTQFTNGDIETKLRLATTTSDDVAKYLQALNKARAVPKGMASRWSPPTGEKLAAIMSYIGSQTDGFRFREGTLRNYKFSIRDAALNLAPNTTVNLRNRLTGTTGVIDEAVGLSATFKNAPGYTELGQIISKDLNIEKGARIDKKFSSLLENVINGEIDVEEINKFNKKSQAFAKKFKIDTPILNIGGDPTKDIKYFTELSEEAQKNVLDLAKGEKGFSIKSAAAPFGMLADKLDTVKANPELFKKLVDTVKKSPDSCRAILDYQTGGISKTCAAALETDPIGSAQKLSQLDDTGPLSKVKNAASAFLRSGGFKTFSVAGLAGGAAAALVKEFRNDDPSTYLSNEDQQKSMLVAMATDPITDDFQRPDILDYQLPLAGALVAGSTVAVAPKTIKASKARGFGIEQKRPGVVKTGFRTLGRGLGVAASPGLLAPLAAMDIAGQISEGDSPLDIATDPLNYLYPDFSETTPKFTRGLPSVVRKAASLGLGKTGLRLLSRAGIVGLGLSLGIQGYNLLNE